MGVHDFAIMQYIILSRKPQFAGFACTMLPMIVGVIFIGHDLLYAVHSEFVVMPVPAFEAAPDSALAMQTDTGMRERRAGHLS